MMIAQKYRDLIKEKGGRILENRTHCKGVYIGDVFTFFGTQGYEVLFFFKDAIFDQEPMVFSVNKYTGSINMCSNSEKFIIITQSNKPIKRKRRK